MSTETLPPTLCPPDTASRPMTAAGPLRRDVESLRPATLLTKLIVYAPGRCRQTILSKSPGSWRSVRHQARDACQQRSQGELSEQRLAEIGGQAAHSPRPKRRWRRRRRRCPSYRHPGASDTRTMALRIFTGERAEFLDDQGAWSAAGELLARRSEDRSPGNGTIFVAPRFGRWRLQR